MRRVALTPVRERFGAAREIDLYASTPAKHEDEGVSLLV